MENVLGCTSKQTATIQKQTFQSIIKDSFLDEEKAEKVFMEVQENLNNMIEEHNSMYEDTPDCEPIALTDKDVQNILIESGIPEDITSQIEKSYVESFGEDLPLAENLIDNKTLKANEQRKKEEHLEKQVAILKTRLEEVKKEAAMDKEEDSITENDDLVSDETLESNSEEILESNLEESEDNTTINSEYDIVLQVKPEKIPEIKSQIIDGQKCIVIPINEDEQTTVNGLDDLI